MLGPVLGAVLGVVLAVTLLPPGAAVAQEEPEPSGPAVVAPPEVEGATRYGRELRASTGEWAAASEPLTFTYRWLRDGERVRGERAATYRLGLADLRHRLQVEVTAHDAEGERERAVSEPTDVVRRAELVLRRAPEVRGVQRYGRTVTATDGRWNADGVRVRHQWLRHGEPVRGATSRTHRIAPEDVGRWLRVRVTATAPGHTRASATSPRTPAVRHRVDVRRRVTYSVATRGPVTASVRDFARLAQQTYDDPRGWRGGGVSFRRVASGGSFTLVLATPEQLPRFSPVCSVQWSCRVGRYVVINQTRWRNASPAWNAAGRSLRDYRHMVVNHETGHWLGLGHAGCPGPGRPAPVMMQQSKGRDGCSFHPWPSLAEQGRA